MAMKNYSLSRDNNDALTAWKVASDTMVQKVRSLVKLEISLGSILTTLSVVGGLVVAIWQGGMVRATLEDGIHAEHDMRVSEYSQLDRRIESMQNDIREMRVAIMRGGK